MLLDELQASLNRSARQGGSVSLLAERDFDAPSRVSLTQDGSGNPLLQLDSDFDRAGPASAVPCRPPTCGSTISIAALASTT